MHKRAIEDGVKATTPDVPGLLDRHLHLPYAYQGLKDQLRESGAKVLHAYLAQNQELLERLEFAEKSIEISLGGGVTVAGRDRPRLPAGVAGDEFVPHSSDLSVRSVRAS